MDNLSPKSKHHLPLLIVIAGPNGSGKTSVTSQLLKSEWVEDALYINPDIIAQEKFGDWNNQEAVINAAKFCEQLREKCLAERKSFIFETVMSAKDKVNFIERAKHAGYFIRIFFISTKSPAINASRIANRVIKGGHDVPIQKIVSRYAKSLVNCHIVGKFVDRLYVYDNSVDGRMPEPLFRLRNGNMGKMYVKELPEWAKNILPDDEIQIQDTTIPD